MWCQGRQGPPQVGLRFRAAAPGASTVYVVHPGALPAGVYHGPADALPDEVGLTELDLGGLPEPTVEALADPALAMRTGHTDATNSPYALAGWSFGGIVAVAVAVADRLPAGQRPARLVLLDRITSGKECWQPQGTLEPSLLLGPLAGYLAAKHGRPERLAAHQLDGCGIDDGPAALLNAGISSGALPPDTPLSSLREQFHRHIDAVMREGRLLWLHRTGPAVQPLVLAKGLHSRARGDPTLGRLPFAARGLEPHTCPGDHYAMPSRPDAAGAIARLVLPITSKRRPQAHPAATWPMGAQPCDHERHSVNASQQSDFSFLAVTMRCHRPAGQTP